MKYNHKVGVQGFSIPRAYKWGQGLKMNLASQLAALKAYSLKDLKDRQKLTASTIILLLVAFSIFALPRSRPNTPNGTGVLEASTSSTDQGSVSPGDTMSTPADTSLTTPTPPATDGGQPGGQASAGGATSSAGTTGTSGGRASTGGSAGGTTRTGSGGQTASNGGGSTTPTNTGGGQGGDCPCKTITTLVNGLPVSQIVPLSYPAPGVPIP